MQTSRRHWILHKALVIFIGTGILLGYQGEVRADAGDHPHCGDTLDGSVKENHTLEHDLTSCPDTTFLTNGANLDLNGFGIYCNRILRCLWIQGEGSDLHNGIMDFSGNRVIDVGGTGFHRVFDVNIPRSDHMGIVVSSSNNEITNNVIGPTAFIGMHVGGSNNLISGNILNESGKPGSAASIYVEGDDNTIERNTANGGGTGIHLQGAAGNVLGRNTALGNSVVDLFDNNDGADAPPCANTWFDNNTYETSEGISECLYKPPAVDFIFSASFEDLPEATVAATVGAASEEGLIDGEFTVSLSQPSRGTTLIHYTLSGTATGIDDYWPLSGIAVINDRMTSVAIAIEVVDDDDTEAPETVILALAPGSYTIGSPASDTVILADNDLGASVVATASGASEEGPLDGEFTISLSQASVGTTTVNYSLSGSATAVDDYAALSGSVDIPDSMDSATVTIAVEPDLDDGEGLETVNLALEAGTGYQVADPPSDTVTIVDTWLRVFVTSTTYTGDLMTEGAAASGLEGADALCNERAAAGSLTGTFVAWASDSSTDAKDRISQTGPYVRTNDDAKVADDIEDIIDCGFGQECIEASIRFNETGGSQTNSEAWTGTGQAGTRTNAHCADWTSDSDALIGVAGGTNSIQSFWTAIQNRSCNNLIRLYCFQAPQTTVVEANIHATQAVANDVTGTDGAYSVTLSSPSVGTTTVHYRISGTADNTVDFATLNGSADITDGLDSAEIPLEVAVDGEVEGPETVILTLANGPGYFIGERNKATAYIMEQAGQFVFITDQRYTADLKSEGAGATGLEGADNLCSAAAVDGGFGSDYVAWISDSTEDAKDRIDPAGPYFRTGTAQTVADDLTDILDCSEACLQTPIRSDQFADDDFHSEVWTGTLATGASSALDCLEWESASDLESGHAGYTGGTGTNWTVGSSGTCNFPQHLRCFPAVNP